MLAATVLTLAALPSAAQSIYRCGSEYSQKPCEGGKAIETQAAPSAADARSAQAQATRNGKLANEMERDRVAREQRVAGPAMLVTGQKGVAMKPEPKASDDRSSKKHAKARKLPTDFTATAPAKPGDKPAKKKSG